MTTNDGEKVKPLTKKQQAQQLAELCDLSIKDAELVIDAYRGLIIGEVQTKGIFDFVGIGKFCKIHKEPRIYINPQTQQRIQGPAKNVIKFKPAKNLKEAVGLTE